MSENIDAVLNSIAARFESGINPQIEHVHLSCAEWQTIKEYRRNTDAKLVQLHQDLKAQGTAAIRGMDAAKESASKMYDHAKKLYAESGPEAIESERAMNEQLTNEIERLERQVEYLSEKVQSLL